MKKLLLFMFVCFASLNLSAQSDLFFSEYIEGSGNNKALEIYNPTNQTINLSNYYILRFSNGSSTFDGGGATRLQGTLAPYKTFVFVNGQTTSTSSSPACDPLLQAMANQLDGIYPAPTYMNGNDAMALVKTPNGVAPAVDMSNVTPVDLFGEIGLGASIEKETGWGTVKDSTLSYNFTINNVVTPITGKVINYVVQAKSYTVNGVVSNAQSGPYWMAWSANHTLIRKPNIVKGVTESPSPFIITKEWDTLPAVINQTGKLSYEDIWTNLGKHRCIADPDFYASLDKVKVSGSQVSVYPNPVVSDRFTVSSQMPVSEIEIFSVIGRSVFHKEFKQGQSQVELESLNLEKGVYLVKVTSPSKITSVKKILVK
ncbi:MAG: lamin tail domain-containing protein [Bacteroidales bacterium]